MNWQLLLLSFPCLFWWFAALPVAAQLVWKGSLLAGALWFSMQLLVLLMACSWPSLHGPVELVR